MIGLSMQKLNPIGNDDQKLNQICQGQGRDDLQSTVHQRGSDGCLQLKQT